MIDHEMPQDDPCQVGVKRYVETFRRPYEDSPAIHIARWCRTLNPPGTILKTGRETTVWVPDDLNLSVLALTTLRGVRAPDDQERLWSYDYKPDGQGGNLGVGWSTSGLSPAVAKLFPEEVLGVMRLLHG